MRRFPVLFLLLAAALALPGCPPDVAEVADPNPPAAAALAPAAEEYVALVLALGRHDPQVVDAYYGPKDWSEKAARGEPVPLPELLRRARALQARVRAAGPSDRRAYLLAQLVALETDLRLRQGEHFTLAGGAAAVRRRAHLPERGRARAGARAPGDPDPRPGRPGAPRGGHAAALHRSVGPDRGRLAGRAPGDAPADGRARGASAG
jgi:hypothetical protein